MSDFQQSKDALLAGIDEVRAEFEGTDEEQVLVDALAEAMVSLTEALDSVSQSVPVIRPALLAIASEAMRMLAVSLDVSCDPEKLALMEAQAAALQAWSATLGQ